MCTTRFLYYFSVYVNLLKELLSFVANRRISGKRVQRYRLFQYLPNISPTFFLFFLLLPYVKDFKGKKEMPLTIDSRERKKMRAAKIKDGADGHRKRPMLNDILLFGN